MSNDLVSARANAIRFDRDLIVDLYVNAHPSFPHRDEFLQLIEEAHRTFLGGCPRASMITAGEALLRVIYVKLVQIAAQRNGLTYSDTTGRSISLGADDLQEPDDELGFCNALEALKQNRRYKQAVTNRLYIIKELRNRAAHGQFPVLDYWDPDDPRSKEEFVKMLHGEVEIPEGYRFKFKGRRSWVTFNCREHACGSLKPLPWLDRYAAIQLAFVLETIPTL